MYMLSSGLVGHGPRLWIPDVLPATDACETSGIRNLRPRPTCPEDSIYIDVGRESFNQYIQKTIYFIIVSSNTSSQNI
jgi:hypothetical protein